VASRPYTHRFVRAYSPGIQVRWYVPAGYRAVVRNVDAINAGTAAAMVGLSVQGYYLVYSTIQVGSNLHVESRMVAYAGEYVEAQVGVAGQTIVASGYLFEDTTGATGPPGTTERIRSEEATPLPSM
jgi:hypothetical protein